jgi:hypothetical protein
VPTEIVVIVEHQDARTGTEALTVKVRSRKTADPRPYDDEVVLLACFVSRGRSWDSLSIPQHMRIELASFVIAAQPLQARRVVRITRWPGDV